MTTTAHQTTIDRIEELRNRGPFERSIEHPDLVPSAEDQAELDELAQLEQALAEALRPTTTEKLHNLAASMGISMECGQPLGDVRDDWPCISYHVALKMNGRIIWQGPYHLGLGHVKVTPQNCAKYGAVRFSDNEESMIATMIRKPHAKFKDQQTQANICAKLARAQKVSPDLASVLSSLCLDASVLQYSSFEEWASEYSYETNSRKAKSIYRACLETALKLNNAIGADKLRELSELAHEL